MNESLRWLKQNRSSFGSAWVLGLVFLQGCSPPQEEEPEPKTIGNSLRAYQQKLLRDGDLHSLSDALRNFGDKNFRELDSVFGFLRAIRIPEENSGLDAVINLIQTLPNGGRGTGGSGITNIPPVANGDSIILTNENTSLGVNAANGVLTNDTDANGDPLSAVLDLGPAKGSLILNADGSFTYTPNANFNGTDSFTYRAFDGSLYSKVATVTLIMDLKIFDANFSSTFIRNFESTSSDQITLNILNLDPVLNSLGVAMALAISGTASDGPNMLYSFSLTEGSINFGKFDLAIGQVDVGKNIATINVDSSTDGIDQSFHLYLGNNDDNTIDLSASLTNNIIFGFDFDDQITGGSGNDVIIGGSGGGTMTGGDGDDVYVVDLTIETIIETNSVNSGIDTVITTANLYVLPDNVENLILLNGVLGIGNASDNTIIGNSNNNTLIGGLGDDIFVYEFGTIGGLGNDTINDFQSVAGNKDILRFDNVGNVILGGDEFEDLRALTNVVDDGLGNVKVNMYNDAANANPIGSVTLIGVAFVSGLHDITDYLVANGSLQVNQA